MKKRIVLLSSLLALSIGAGTWLLAGENADEGPTTAPSTQPTAAAEPVNKICLVSGEKVDPSATTIVYEGKVIGFCCDDCIKDFKKDPKKYMAKLK